MSARYISALPPDHAFSVLGIGLRRAEGSEQSVQFWVVGVVEPDGEAEALSRGRSSKSCLAKSGLALARRLGAGGCGDLFQAGSVACDGLPGVPGEVVPQVPAVSDLDRGGGAIAGVL
jgi:hypothetical protein